MVHMSISDSMKTKTEGTKKQQLRHMMDLVKSGNRSQLHPPLDTLRVLGLSTGCCKYDARWAERLMEGPEWAALGAPPPDEPEPPGRVQNIVLGAFEKTHRRRAAVQRQRAVL